MVLHECEKRGLAERVLLGSVGSIEPNFLPLESTRIPVTAEPVRIVWKKEKVRFKETNQKQSDDVVRLHERAVLVDDAKAVRVAVGCDPYAGSGLAHLGAQIFKQMVVGLRGMSAK